MTPEQNSTSFPSPQPAHTLLPGSAILKGQLPDRVGNFRITKIIGEGGMGVVGLGVETEGHAEKRRVAIKFLKRDIKNDSFESRLFEQECRSLARFNHDNIARLFDFGYYNGNKRLPYIIMEYVEEATLITDYCAGHSPIGPPKPLPLRERLGLFLKICDGIRHAHERNVIHRDISPKNILVGRVDGKPVVKIIDFGIALNFEDKDLRERGALGTPAYMSPEQLAGDPSHVDQRSDIYALGILLCELMVGRLPHEFTSAEEAKTVLTAMQTQGQTALLPSQIARDLSTTRAVNGGSRFWTRLARELRGDLDAIVAKATALNPDDRYKSVAQLAEDIEEHLHGRPLKHAIHPSTAIRVIKFVRRNRFATAATAAIFLMLLGLTSLALFHYRQTIRQNAALETARAKLEANNKILWQQNRRLWRAQQQAYSSMLATFPLLLGEGKLGEARAVLANTRSVPGRSSFEKGWEWDYLLGSSDQSEMVLGQSRTGFVRAIDAGASICAVAGDQSVWFWRSSDGKFLSVDASSTTPILDLGSDGSTVFAVDANGKIRRWAASSGDPANPGSVSLQGLGERARILAASINPTLRKLALQWQSDGGARSRLGVFDLDQGLAVGQPVSVPVDTVFCWRQDGTIQTGEILAGDAGPSTRYRVWRILGGDQPLQVERESSLDSGSDDTPLPRMLVSRGNQEFLGFENSLILAEWRDEALQPLSGISGGIEALAVAENGLSGAVAISGGGIYRFTAQAGEIELQASGITHAVGRLTGHANTIHDLAFAGRGDRLLLSASSDGTVRVWNPATASCARLLSFVRILLPRFHELSEDQKSRLGNDLLNRMHSSQIGWCRTIEDGGRRGVLAVLDMPPWIVHFGCQDGRVETCPPTAGFELPGFLTDNLQAPLAETPRIVGAGASSDGRIIAILRLAADLRTLQIVVGNLMDERPRLWVSDPSEIPANPRLAVSEDGLQVVANRLTAEGAEELVVWDFKNGRERPSEVLLSDFPAEAGSLSALALDPRGQWLAAGWTDGSLRLWKMSNGTPEADSLQSVNFAAEIRSIAFSSSTNVIAVALATETPEEWIGRGFGFVRLGADGIVENPVMPDAPRAAGHLSQAICWNSAGTRLASADSDGVLRIWAFPRDDASEFPEVQASDPTTYFEDCTLVLELRDAHVDEIALPLRSVAWSADGRWLAAVNASEGGFLYYGAEDDPAAHRRRVQLEIDEVLKRVPNLAQLYHRWRDIPELTRLEQSDEVAAAVSRIGLHPHEVTLWAWSSLLGLEQLPPGLLSASRVMERQAFVDALERDARRLNDPARFQALALAYYRLNDFSRARSSLERAEGGSTEVNKLLGALIAARQNDPAPARELLETSSKLTASTQLRALWDELRQVTAGEASP